MPINFDLHIVATSVEDLKKQLKDAYESLEPVAPPVVESTPLAKITSEKQKQPKEQNELEEYLTTQTIKTQSAMKERIKNLKKFTGPIYGWNVDNDDNLTPNWGEQRNIAFMQKMLKSGSPASAVAAELNKRGISTKKGSQWTPTGVTRTANYHLHTRISEFTNPASKKRAVLPKRSSLDRKKERTTTIHKNIRDKAPKKIKPVPKPVKKKPQPIVEVDLSDETFGAWLTTNLGSLVLRNKHFLIASSVIKNWYTTLMSEESYGSWVLTNGDSKMAMMKKAFEAFQTAHPTIFLLQDSGDNFVLAVTNPTPLTTKLVREIDFGFGV